MSSIMGKRLVVVGIVLSLLAHGAAAQPSAGDTKEKTAQTSTSLPGDMDKGGPVMAEIGQEVAALVGGDPDGVFLYAEMVDGRTFLMLHKDVGKAIRMYRDSSKLEMLIQEAWALANPDPRKRWIAMEYDVRGRAFDVHYLYADQIDKKADAAQRIGAALSARFAGKRLVADPALIKEAPEMAVYSARRRPVLIPPL
ncbi:hypothetical protein [Sphingobium nicotianae]|uniref:Uncharacterized protein n=1 Tax=Sphingobium nicotianae TaxID=2782607 RepID=A0A9X1DD15_9SPHN|nr:hypothetical protein [Sphingobium nicotianae]MBT2187907.1 hypothetical protein [Sphingobium nicotianae]